MTSPASPITQPATRPAPAPATPGARPQVSEGDGDHDRFAHYVPKHQLTRAYVEGLPVRALCGKVWVPSRDPDRYRICPTCREIREGAAFGQGAGDDTAGE